MADRTTLASVAISSSYQQLLFVADTTGVPATSASPADSLIYSSGGKKAAFKIGFDQCSIPTGSHNFDVASHNGTYGLKLGFDQCSIPSGSHNFDIASHNGTYGLKLGGSIVTATATELNYNDITTLGTSQASKAVTVDSS